MGAAGSRFGRNFPISYGYPEPEPAILEPNPRTVSRELMTRHTFAPGDHAQRAGCRLVTVHDPRLVQPREEPKENPWQVPLKEDDPWHENPMHIMRTRPDPTRPPGDDGTPPTYVNTETHWWDGSQLYGSRKEIQARCALA